KELKQIEADDQAIQTILLGQDIYVAVDSYETAQEIWLHVQQMMKGSDIGIQEKKAKMFNEWEMFPSNEGESIEAECRESGWIGNGNLVAARAEGNAAGQNGNQIRCYNCRGVGHYARNCIVRPRRRHAAYLQIQLLIAQKEEQASISGTQTDSTPVYDTDGSAENDNDVISEDTSVEQGGETVEQHPANFEETQKMPSFDSIVRGFASLGHGLGNSYVYDPNPNSFDCLPDSYHPSHPTYETYSYDSYGNDSQFGYDCQPQFPLYYKSEPGYNENYTSYPYDSSSVPQQYPCCARCGGPHETCQCDQLIFDEPYCKHCGGPHMNYQFVALPATDQAPSAKKTEPFETDESAATPPPHPAYRITARISIPAPLPAESTSHSLPLPPPFILSPTRSDAPSSGTPPPLPISAPTSSPPLQLPSASHREDRPKVTLPPQKRLGIALGPRYEVGESSSAAAARPAGGLKADYDFVATMDREIKRDPEREARAGGLYWGRWWSASGSLGLWWKVAGVEGSGVEMFGGKNGLQVLQSPKDTRRIGAAEPQRRHVLVETSTINALASQCDGIESYDWSYQAEEKLANFVLMAIPSSSSASDNEVQSCSKACSKAYEQLHSQYDKLNNEFQKSWIDVLSYQAGLESVEARLVLSQPSGEYHVVPSPITGNFMPPKPDLVFHTALIAVETTHSAFTVQLSPAKPAQYISHATRPMAPIIEDWVSDSEDESEPNDPQSADF
nr:hypothetical protein [Tanacetum cinerariifolium]